MSGRAQHACPPGSCAPCSASLDFANPDALRQLTRALLREDFGVTDWWVPDGQLIPPVPNRLNYIHWIEDLLRLSSPPGATSARSRGLNSRVAGGCQQRAPRVDNFRWANGWNMESRASSCSHDDRGMARRLSLTCTAAARHRQMRRCFYSLTGPVKGLDIGCGANLIYPLLGAAMNGWAFVAADVTSVAVEWARRNAAANPHLAPLLDVRHVGGEGPEAAVPERVEPPPLSSRSARRCAHVGSAAFTATQSSEPPRRNRSGTGQREETGPSSRRPSARGESFAFTICNPPFFGSAAEAGLNPYTAHGGAWRHAFLLVCLIYRHRTSLAMQSLSQGARIQCIIIRQRCGAHRMEVSIYWLGVPQAPTPRMVYPGGEAAFVRQMVLDSTALRGAVHWYTSMVGKKATLSAVKQLAWQHGATAVRTTELSQGALALHRALQMPCSAHKT